MGVELRPWLVEHWPIKLAALVLAVVVWIAVAADQPATQLRPVDVVIELPDGRALSQPIPNVSALVAGRVHELLGLYTTPLRIHKAVVDTSGSSAMTLALAPGDVVLPPEVSASVLDVQPREITILLDDVVRRRVGVEARVTVNADSGFVVVGGVSIMPAEVDVMGSRRIVEAIDAVPTVLTDIVDARAPVTRSVPLDLQDLGTVTVHPSSVEVRADVAELAERLFPNLPVELGGSAFIADPASVELVVRGPASLLARVTADSFTVSATIPRDASVGDSVSLFAVGPLGITAVPAPTVVRLRRRRP